jgi:hypothetical protein
MWYSQHVSGPLLGWQARVRPTSDIFGMPVSDYCKVAQGFTNATAITSGDIGVVPFGAFKPNQATASPHVEAGEIIVQR